MSKPRVLVIDDDLLTAEVVRDVLAEQFVVEHAVDGASGLAQAEAVPPSLILLDIHMPGWDGYQTCTALKASACLTQVPVVFLSGLTSLEDRLAAYDAGGDDFVAKPFDPTELQRLAEIYRHRSEERQQLADAAAYASAAAFTAMSNAGEMGVLLEFTRRSYLCSSYHNLASLILECIGQYGLAGAVAIRTGSLTVTRNSEGTPSAMENGVLEKLAQCGRVVTLGKRAAFNYPQTTLLINNMPIEDDDRAGRLRDHLASLCEAADARTKALSYERQAAQQARQLSRLIEEVKTTLAGINANHTADRRKAAFILEDMLLNVERQFVLMGLSESQEESIVTLLRQSSYQVLDLYDRGQQTDQTLKGLLAELTVKT